MTLVTRHQPIITPIGTPAGERSSSHRSSPPSIHRPKEIGDYCLSKTIGRGASGRVKLGIHKYTGERVAIKMIARSQLLSSRLTSRSVQRELAILQLLDHPNIVDLRHVLQDSHYVYFVMEYIEGGELFHALARRGKFSEDHARSLFRQLVTALTWCHSHHICHRDLKPENILLDKDQKQIKIVDFGMAAIQSPRSMLRTSCGSPHYASPEIVKGIPYDGQAADIWSCGIILYALLTGHLPFDDDNLGRLLSKIKTGKYRPLPNTLSHEAVDLIRRMLQTHPTQRIEMAAILQHPWLTNASFLGTDSRFPPAHIPIDIPTADPFSLQQQHLQGPMISSPSDLDGRVWETLKVLWRDMTLDHLVTSLVSDAPNVQKLTCHLLRERTRRTVEEGEAGRCASAPATTTTSTRMEEPPSSPTMSIPPRRSSDMDSKSSFSRDTGYDSRASSVSCCRTVDMPPTPESPTTVDFDALKQERPIEPRMLWDAQEDSYRMVCPTTNLFEGGLTTLSHPDTCTTSTTPTHAQAVFSSPSRYTASRPSSCASTSATIGTTTTTTSAWLGIKSVMQKVTDVYHHVVATVQHHTHRSSEPSSTLSRRYTISCQARHECEAAGKLHQVLEEQLQGQLCGRLYPNGRILWHGSLVPTEKNARPLRFLCQIEILAKNQTTAHVQFVKGDPQQLCTAMSQLQRILDGYEAECSTLASANGWSL